MPEPSEGARRAAERILKSPWAYEFDGEHKVYKLAQIIDSETRCGEMRKALEHQVLRNHNYSPDGCSACEAARNALNGGPQLARR